MRKRKKIKKFIILKKFKKFDIIYIEIILGDNIMTEKSKNINNTYIKKLRLLDIDIEKIKADRIEYGYDSLCLRIDKLVTELAETKAALDHSRTLSDWKRHYGMQAVRIYDILDDLLDGKGHSQCRK